MPLTKIEYSDGSGWYPLATESWVQSTYPGTVTSLTAGTGLSGGTITTNGTIAIASVGVAAGVYEWPNSLRINAQGQVIGVNRGLQPLTSLIAGPGLSIFQGGEFAQINITNTGVTSGTHTWPSAFSVNQQGQLTSVVSSGSLPINRLQNYPANSSAFLRGDGAWTLPFINNLSINGDVSFSSYGLTTSGTISATTGTLQGNNLAAYNSGSIVVQNPLSMGNGGATPISITTDAASGNICLNNTNTSSFATGLMIQNNGVSAVAFGFDNSSNEGYMWGYGSATLKFGTNGAKRVELLNNGTLDMLSNRITGLPAPTTSSDPTTKDYVDVRCDKYQTLSYASYVTWNTTLGNIAVLTLSGNCSIYNIICDNAAPSTFLLFVKQDVSGSRSLNIYNIYRSGSGSSLMPLTSAPNAIDCLMFKRSGESGDLYLYEVINNFQFASAPSSKYIFDYTGVVQSITIPPSPTNTCRIKLLGGGGGQGLYSAGSGSSGAGGYTIYYFNTLSYIGQTLSFRTGRGGEGGIYATRAGAGGWPNGGRGISGNTYPGGGGGRSEVRLGSSSGIILAVAGGGGGGTGYTTNGLGAGGGISGQNGALSGSGGTQSAGGLSASGAPAQFQQAGFLQGAGATTTLTAQAYDTGGGGDGYYGGGCSGGGGKTSGGGSGYLNTTFVGYSASSVTYQGSGATIPLTASADSDFSGGYGIGQLGAGSSGSGLRGGQGRIVVEFI